MGESTANNARLTDELDYRRKAGDLSALSEALKAQGRLMGLDVSPNHIGVAISYESSALAVATIARKRFAEDIAALNKIIAEHQIQGIIIGLPLQMDGREGRRAQSVRDFARLLGEAIALPLAFWDERLTTKEAEAHPLSKKAKSKTDALAAAIILQAALARLAP